MRAILQLAFAGTFPLVCLAMLLWLSYLEDTLPQSVRRTVRKPDPPPVLAIPTQRRPVAAIPTQRRPVHDELPEVQPEPVYTPEVSRSEGLSLGGSTNR